MKPFQNIFPTAIIPKGLMNHTDHLGNIRVTYTKNLQTGTLEIMEENHYCPGACPEPCRRRLKHKVYSSLTPKGFIADEELEGGTLLVHLREDEFKYKYNGKEWQDELEWNMYAMDMRMYDPAIARWVVQDPIVHFNQSPYSSFDGNPVFWADPSGASVTTLTGEAAQDFITWLKQNLKGDDEECDDPPCNKPSKIAIDPGHGIQGNNNPAMDRGTSGNGLKESDLTLTISEYVNSFLQSFGEDTTMIREGELIVEGNSLIYRTNKAKKESADIFVSIHINAVKDNKDASGFTVLYKNSGNYKEQNKALAKSISDNQKLMSVRGNGLTVRNDLMVLNSFSSTGPAVLVEVGFITNSSDANLMSKYPNVIARDIALGIYLFLVNNNR